jgi:NO-binding membrane sensor protein with MHYT domain
VIAPLVFGWLAAEAAIWYEAHGQEVALAEKSGLRLAVLSIAAFVFLGMLLLLLVNEKKAIAAAREAPTS